MDQNSLEQFLSMNGLQKHFDPIVEAGYDSLINLLEADRAEVLNMAGEIGMSEPDKIKFEDALLSMEKQWTPERVREAREAVEGNPVKRQLKNMWTKAKAKAKEVVNPPPEGNIAFYASDDDQRPRRTDLHLAYASTGRDQSRPKTDQKAQFLAYTSTDPGTGGGKKKKRKSRKSSKKKRKSRKRRKSKKGRRSRRKR